MDVNQMKKKGMCVCESLKGALSVCVRVRVGVRDMHGPALGCDSRVVLWESIFLRGRFCRAVS